MQQILCVAFSQTHEWDSQNVIMTGSTDGVARVRRTFLSFLIYFYTYESLTSVQNIRDFRTTRILLTDVVDGLRASACGGGEAGGGGGRQREERGAEQRGESNRNDEEESPRTGQANEHIRRGVG